jgi:predicted AAA+ superfamily ATPase
MLNRTLILPAKRSCLLFGPRQTGKSTLVRSLLPKGAWTVDLLSPGVALRLAKDPAQFAREAEQKIAGGVKTIFVDEVQRVPELLNEVHRLIEAHGVRFILTGSSARKLKRGGANLLAGRAATRRLHPLTAAEVGGGFDLERTLRFGSLPAVVTSDDDDARDLLRAYGETYLHEEIQAESIVRNLGGFARFLDVAAAQCGDILNYSSVGRDAGLATRTVQEYFQILEDTLIGYRLEAWRASPRARMTAHPRFYLFDTGVTNALNRRLGAEPDPASRGRLFEQLVVLETMRLLDYADIEARLYYWRTNVGAEVDLLVERHGKLRLAVEIKSGSRVVGADLTGLRSFRDAHPRVPCLVVANVPEPYRLDTIEVMSFAAYVAELVDRVRA